MKMKLSDIITTAGTQMRVQLNDDAVQEYMQVADDLPPVNVFDDDGKYYLVDGFHRFEAKKKANAKEINCLVQKGTLRDAILFAVQANSDHGVRRTNADKRKAVETLLKDEEWGTWSGREIARFCHVSESTVRNIRESSLRILRSEDSGDDSTEERKYKTKHGTTATMKTGNIGKNQPEKSKKKITGGNTFNVDEFEDDPEEAIEEPVHGDDSEEYDLHEHLKEVDRMFLRWSGLVNQIQQEMNEFSGQDIGIRLRHSAQTLKNRCDSLRGYILTDRPYCICFMCGGGGCPSCYESGWMNKIGHKSHDSEGKEVVKV